MELQDPVLAGDDVVYTVKILQDQMPAKAAESLFTDVIGMRRRATSLPARILFLTC